MAAHGGHARRPDERPGAGRPVRRRDAEALVGEQHDAGVRRLRAHPSDVGALRLQDGLRPPDAHLRAERGQLLRQLPREARTRAEPRGGAGTGDHPEPRARGRARLPAVVARLLPVRLRGDHADPDARLGARPRELQGLDPVRPALVDLRLHGQRLPDLGRRLVRPAGGGRLQRRLRHPPRGGRLRLRRRLGDRSPSRTRPRDRRAEQPGDGRSRRRPALAGLERLQRRRPVQRRRGRGVGGAEHEPRHGRRVPRLGHLRLRDRAQAVTARQRQRHDRRPRRDHPGGRLRERLRRDRDRRDRARSLVYVAYNYLALVPALPERRRHARRGLHARLRRPHRRTAHRPARRLGDGGRARVLGHREGCTCSSGRRSPRSG